MEKVELSSGLPIPIEFEYLLQCSNRDVSILYRIEIKRKYRERKNGNTFFYSSVMNVVCPMVWGCFPSSVSVFSTRAWLMNSIQSCERNWNAIYWYRWSFYQMISSSHVSHCTLQCDEVIFFPQQPTFFPLLLASINI